MTGRFGVTRPALAWALCGLTLAIVAAAAIIAIVDPGSAGPVDTSARPAPGDEVAGGGVLVAVLQASTFCAFAVAGAVMAARRPRNPVGWLFSAAGLFLALLTLTSILYWHLAFGQSNPSGSAELLLWTQSWAWVPPVVTLFVLIPLLFPTGRPPTPRWRLVGWAAVAGGIALIVGTAFGPGSFENYPWAENPLGVAGFPGKTLVGVSFFVCIAAALAAVASLVLRYHRSHGVERQQLKWVTAAGSLLVLSFLVGGLLTDWVSEQAGWAAMVVGFSTLAAAVAIALLRYRLYDIDVVVNRALVYGALTMTLAGSYFGLVLLLQVLLSPSSDLAVAGSTLAVAALFRPARSRIQHAVDRRFYRRRYDAARTLERFGARLRDEVDLESLGGELRAVVAETMQPAHISVWVREVSR
jgi:hypothetical protein